MIQQWLYKVDQCNTNKLIAGAIAFALILASWIQYNQHGWINPDSVLYFEQAKQFIAGDWAAMLSLFDWPMYAICIGLMHQLTSFSIHTSAQWLNVIFFCLATFGFLRLLKQLNGTNRTLFFGACLLFSSQYIVGDVLEMLMRDEGFWAFYLSGLYFFVRFAQMGKMADAVFWQLCLIVATLFRLEAILYLLLLPISYFLLIRAPLKERITSILSSCSAVLVMGLLMTVFLLMHSEASMSHFGRLDEVFDTQLFNHVTAKLFSRADLMGQEVLGRYLDEFSIQGLLLTFIFVIISKSIDATGYITAVLAYFGMKDKKSAFSPIGKRILITLTIICLIAASLIVIKAFVLSKRYLVSLVWLALIFASFQLAKISLSPAQKSRLFVAIISIVMIAGTIKNILPKREGYNYQQNAIAWLKKSNQANAPVYYSDSRLRYYANAKFLSYGDLWPSFSQQLNESEDLAYEYLVIPISRRDQDKLSLIKQKLYQYQEIKRFYAPANKKYCAIYQKKSSVN